MGDPRKLHRKFETPKRVWDAPRIEEEEALVEEYGLRSMHELWVVRKELRKIRREARRLLGLGDAGRSAAKPLFDKCISWGIANTETKLEDLLGLSVRDLLERRLATRVLKKGLSRSIRQARQLIAHNFIAIGNQAISAPGYIVPIADDDKVSYYKPFDINAGMEKPAAPGGETAPKAPVPQEALLKEKREVPAAHPAPPHAHAENKEAGTPAPSS